MSSSAEKRVAPAPRTVEENRALVKEVLDAYPEKARKKREKHVGVVDAEQLAKGECAVKSNVKSLPGVMTVRGCAYAGSKGVVWGPIKDMIHVSHGPVGCGHYSWAARRNYSAGTGGVDNFVAMQFTSDFQEKDIVFGGDKKLDKLLTEANELFPLARGLSIQSECPIGLIGDDIEQVSKRKAQELSKPVIPVRCEGFRGVSQSLGHHIANDAIRDWVLPGKDGKSRIDAKPRVAPGPYDVAVIGDYNIGGDAWASRILLEEMGLRVVAQWSGDGTLTELAGTVGAKLNLVHCYRSMNYISRYMEEAHGIPWLEYNFFGPTRIAESLRAIAARFDDRIREGAERVIAKYRPMSDAILEKYRPRLKGKTVMLYVGGLRPRHVVGAYEDLGMTVAGTGYEFAHADDYKRTAEHVKEGTLIYDDATEHELERFVEAVRPDLVGSGIKEKYVFQKMGVPFRQMHSWDYSGPYHGYDGFAIFARDIDMAVNAPIWKRTGTPWRRS